MNKFNFVIIQPVIISPSKNICITKVYKNGCLVDYDINYNNNNPSIEFCKKWKSNFKQYKRNKPFLLDYKDIECIKFDCNYNLYKKPRLYRGSQKLNQKLMMLKLKGKLKGNVDYYISSKLLKNSSLLHMIEPIKYCLNWYHELKNNDKCNWENFILEINETCDYCNIFSDTREAVYNNASIMDKQEANKYICKYLLPYVLKYAKHLLYKDKNKYKRLP